jgi:hypothetical protein
MRPELRYGAEVVFDGATLRRTGPVVAGSGGETVIEDGQDGQTEPEVLLAASQVSCTVLDGRGYHPDRLVARSVLTLSPAPLLARWS